MQRPHFPLELVKLSPRRFRDQKHFGLSFNLSLPPINRFHLRQDLHARGEVGANQHVREPRRFFAIRGRHKNYNRILIHRELLFFIVFNIILARATRERRLVLAKESRVDLQRAISITLIDENHGAIGSRG